MREAREGKEVVDMLPWFEFGHGVGLSFLLGTKLPA